MSQVQVLIGDEGNRQALVELLEERHDIVGGGTVRDADLHVVDDRTLPEHRDALLARKEEYHPVFCPVVLIRREDTRIHIQLPDPDEVDGPQIVNEILTAPVDRSVLFRRLTNLLVRRSQTDELREKNERLDRFASMASHELRNPLGILDAYLSLARDRGNPEDFEQCQQAVERMNRQIDDLLTLARKGATPVEPEPVVLSSAAESCWEMVGVSEADLEVETDERVRADEDRLFEVLSNLFRNAIEHGGRDVTITVGSLSDGFYVADDGRGIPAEESDQIFEDGFSTARHGTGFGFTIIGRIADAHDWDVTADEATAGGARFEFSGVERVADESSREE